MLWNYNVDFQHAATTIMHQPHTIVMGGACTYSINTHKNSKCVEYLQVTTCSSTPRTPEDTEGREYVVLDAQLERFKDPKRNYAFTVQLRGVPEPLFFGSDEESIVNEWIVRLESASKSKG